MARAEASVVPMSTAATAPRDSIGTPDTTFFNLEKRPLEEPVVQEEQVVVAVEIPVVVSGSKHFLADEVATAKMEATAVDEQERALVDGCALGHDEASGVEATRRRRSTGRRRARQTATPLRSRSLTSKIDWRRRC